MALTLPRRPGDFAVYETPDGAIRFHIEAPSRGQPTLYGVENVSEGFTLVPRTKPEVERLVAKHKLHFVEFGC
jgi:hypothetical protein